MTDEDSTENIFTDPTKKHCVNLNDWRMIYKKRLNNIITIHWNIHHLILSWFSLTPGAWTSSLRLTQPHWSLWSSPAHLDLDHWGDECFSVVQTLLVDPTSVIILTQCLNEWFNDNIFQRLLVDLSSQNWVQRLF